MIKHHLHMMCQLMLSLMEDEDLELSGAATLIYEAAKQALAEPPSNDCEECSDSAKGNIRLEGAAEAVRSELIRLKEKLNEQDELTDADESSVQRVIAMLDTHLYEQEEEKEKEEEEEEDED